MVPLPLLFHRFAMENAFPRALATPACLAEGRTYRTSERKETAKKGALWLLGRRCWLLLFMCLWWLAMAVLDSGVANACRARHANTLPCGTPFFRCAGLGDVYMEDGVLFAVLARGICPSNTCHHHYLVSASASALSIILMLETAVSFAVVRVRSLAKRCC